MCNGNDELSIRKFSYLGLKSINSLFPASIQSIIGNILNSQSDSGAYGNGTHIEVPSLFRGLFSQGRYEIKLSESTRFSTIKLYQRRSEMLDLICNLTSGLTLFVENFCLCDGDAPRFSDSTYSTSWCIIHPCTSNDLKLGRCNFDVDPFQHTCIQSPDLSSSEIKYSIFTPTFQINFNNTSIIFPEWLLSWLVKLLPIVDIPVMGHRFCLSLLVIRLASTNKSSWLALYLLLQVGLFVSFTILKSTAQW